MSNMTLKEARELVRLSQAELAARSGLQRSAIYDLETNRSKRPAWVTVFRITEALKAAGLPGLTPQQIFPVERAA